MDILVTTPKSSSKSSEQEAVNCINDGGGYYFRTFKVKPKHLKPGVRVFYVEDGYIRGFGIVESVVNGSQRCSTTGKDWGEGHHALIPARSWCWIKPIPHKGFQGYHYVMLDFEVVGGWLDKKPKIEVHCE
jgi:hypothetical protein